MTALTQRIKEKAEEYFDYMVQVRRHLHRNPEVSFEEYDTTKYILGELKKRGIETVQPLETGCIGIIRGDLPGKVIALRADIDALPMAEEGDAKLEFLSNRPGAAHCCGHDFHTANLLGVANILMDLQDEIKGTVILVFQPAEEKLPGGADILCRSGVLQKIGVEEVYGLHTYPDLEPGEIGVKAGPIMACTSEFEVEIIGKGGHAAAPHTTIDPIVTAAHVIQQFQTIVSRTMNPTDASVITVGRIEGGTAHNIIPERVKMIGTVRTLSLETTKFIKMKMDKVLKGVTSVVDAGYSFQFREGYPAVVNDETCTKTVIQTARKVTGHEDISVLEKPVMAAEDFAFYQQHFPGAFFFLGSGSTKADSQWSWHHPRYNVDEDAFRTGASVMAGIILLRGNNDIVKDNLR